MIPRLRGKAGGKRAGEDVQNATMPSCCAEMSLDMCMCVCVGHGYDITAIL